MRAFRASRRGRQGEVEAIVTIVETWRNDFQASGVPAKDIECGRSWRNASFSKGSSN